jgi:hypothetical protein
MFTRGYPEIFLGKKREADIAGVLRMLQENSLLFPSKAGPSPIPGSHPARLEITHFSMNFYIMKLVNDPSTKHGIVDGCI